MSQSKYLVQTIFLPRQVGYTLAVLLTVFLLGPALLVRPTVVVFLIWLLIYPTLVFQLTLRARIPADTARWTMLCDGVLVGCLILANEFYLLAAVAYVTFLSVSTAVIAKPIVVWINLAVVGVISGFGWVLGIPHREIVPFWLDLLFGLGMLLYLGFVAWLVFGVTESLGRARLDERTAKQSLQEVTENLKRYISPQLYASLSKEPSQKSTSRRQLTVCFTDLTGFTELTDRLPEESLTRVLNEYLNAMAEIAIRHGGTVDKFMGDGIMVFFGDPQSKGASKDAEACVTMALEMRSSLSELSRQWRFEGIDNHLSMRIGIHTGYCAVGNFGSENRMDYTAVGGTVNIASRLEGCAMTGEILISEQTCQLVQTSICAEHSERRQLKGIRQPVTSFRVLGKHRDLQIPDMDEQIPGLRLHMISREVDVDAARVLIRLALASLDRIEGAIQPRQGRVRLLR